MAVTVVASLSRGTDELLGVMDQVTIINSTLGKALGGASGAAASCARDPLPTCSAPEMVGSQEVGKDRPGLPGRGPGVPSGS